MKFITVATRENDGLKRLLRSCDHFGIDMNVLGFGLPYYGNGSKIEFIMDFLTALPSNEIIFFTDAYDSFFVREPAPLEEDFGKFDHPVLFSAEDNYYFRIQAVQNLVLNPYYRLKYPKSKSTFPPYRYLNSGGYMGYAGKVLEVFTAANINKKMQSDQVNLHRFFVNHPDRICLDYDHEIFTNYGKFATPERFTVNNDLLTNELTETQPYIFHFPGPKHRGMEEFAAQFSFLK